MILTTVPSKMYETITFFRKTVVLKIRKLLAETFINLTHVYKRDFFDTIL
jgi:hypothetical protein